MILTALSNDDSLSSTMRFKNRSLTVRSCGRGTRTCLSKITKKKDPSIDQVLEGRFESHIDLYVKDNRVKISSTQVEFHNAGSHVRVSWRRNVK